MTRPAARRLFLSSRTPAGQAGPRGERSPRGATRECVAAKNLRIGADLAARFAFVETKA